VVRVLRAAVSDGDDAKSGLAEHTLARMLELLHAAGCRGRTSESFFTNWRLRTSSEVDSLGRGRAIITRAAYCRTGSWQRLFDPPGAPHGFYVGYGPNE